MSKKEKARNESQCRKEKYKELLDKGGILGKPNLYIAFNLATAIWFIHLKSAANAETSNVIDTLKTIQSLMERSDEITGRAALADRVDNSSEVVMDAQVIKMSHEILGSAMLSISGTEFNDDQYIDCLVNTDIYL